MVNLQDISRSENDLDQNKEWVKLLPKRNIIPSIIFEATIFTTIYCRNSEISFNQDTCLEC